MASSMYGFFGGGGGGGGAGEPDFRRSFAWSSSACFSAAVSCLLFRRAAGIAETGGNRQGSRR